MTIGYADLHCHPMVHLSFGGKVKGRSLFWGTPTDHLPEALSSCASAHAASKGKGLSRFVPGLVECEKSYDGYNTFGSWPRSISRIHQQMYITEVRRAYEHGLKLMVASAVNNEMLADAYHGCTARSFDEFAIRCQLNGMRRVAEEQREWMSIVECPEEAEEAIQANKLAVILGIEVDSIAGPCMRREGQLDPAKAAGIVDRWWKKGVRFITPIHIVDNALGGTAIYDDRFNCLNHYLIRKHARHLPDPWYFSIQSANEESKVRYLLSADLCTLAPAVAYGVWAGDYYRSPIHNFGEFGHVNARGLSEAGEAFVRAMMDHGMLIDVEHMSSRALARTLEIAESAYYPLVSSHTALRPLAVERHEGQPYVKGCAHEGMRTCAEMERLRELGGVLGIGGHVGRIRGRPDISSSWADAYKFATNELKFRAVAIGTDMNGFAEAPGPRFVRDEFQPTGRRVINDWDPVPAVKYGEDVIPKGSAKLTPTKFGCREYDYNVDGLAHYGLLPDFTVDVAHVLQEKAMRDAKRREARRKASREETWPEKGDEKGEEMWFERGEELLNAFFNSADAVVKAWSACVERARSRPGGKECLRARSTGPCAATSRRA